MTFESKATQDGLTLKVYRGEGAALLAFNLTKSLATRTFVGFSVEVRYPGSTRWGALKNRLHFEYPPGATHGRAFRSTEAPFQKFRWIHVPTGTPAGDFRYRVTAQYMETDGVLTPGPSVECGISLAPETIDGFVNVGFTRGFASSQAYATRFNNETGILPPIGAPALASLAHDMSPYTDHYDWLGFEARRLIYGLLDEVGADASLSIDALIYECKEPGILARFEAIGTRLRAIIDDHGDHGKDDSCETESAARLGAAGADIKRMHFGRQQHNKVLLIKRNGVPERVLAGSTNFSLRGLYVQANNVLLFDDPAIASAFSEAFEEYWNRPSKFRRSAIAQDWHVVRDLPESKVSVCFSPHVAAEVSLDPIAAAINDAESSVLYSIVFLNQLSGPVREALDDLMRRDLFSYGVAQRTGGLDVVKPDGTKGLLPFAYLAGQAPPPFNSEWSGNTQGHSNMVHHKFLVTDFNRRNARVYTGSSNMAAGGEKANADHLICIEDRAVATAYAIEALKMFDHFHFRSKARASARPITLAKPPLGNAKPWFAPYYLQGHIKQRDRLLFVS